MDEFDKNLNEIKTKLNDIKLSDEFKENLKIQMENELNKSKTKEKNRTILFPRRLVATFACFFLLISGCVTFADEIECLVTKIFSNTDKIVEEAIANGNYKEIDMEYVKDNGVSIKVDYVIIEDDSLYIAFNVLTEEEMKTIYFEDIEITDIDKNVIHKLTNNKANINTEYSSYVKLIEKNKYSVIYRINIDEFNFEKDNIYIQINEIGYQGNNNYNRKNGKWILDINV